VGKVLLEMTVSLDGYSAGPDIGPNEPLGRGGEQLHDWMFGGTPAEAERLQADKFASVGAVIVGRRMADLGIGNWGDDPVFHAPVFVITHRPAEPIVKHGGTSYTFVTDGIEAALEQAREAAGAQNVHLGGGAEIARQFLNAGLVDEVQLHISPMILGGGERLFDGVDPGIRLVLRDASSERGATHLVYSVESE
jgi:dihydrofolate reductase